MMVKRYVHPSEASRADQVHVHVAEAVARHWDVEWLHMHVLGDLAPLAWEAHV